MGSAHGTYAALTLLAAERSRRKSGMGQEIRVPLSDIALATVGNLGQIGEISISGRDRPKNGNEIYGAFGRDFITRDGRRLMIAAITARQWKGLIKALGMETEIGALEGELGVSFVEDEGLRFRHGARLMPLFEASFAQRNTAELTAAFEINAVCWAPYQTLKQALDHDRYFSAENPILTEIAHPSGHRYLAPGFAATLPGETRKPATAAPAIGRHTDEVLSDVLVLSHSEITRLHETGMAANA